MKTAMISSTALDLPEHRSMVMDACHRLGFRPIMMEHLAAQDRSANDVSIGMVEEADVYLGIFAFAYGSSPENDTRSYTEIELDRAVSLGIPVIPFFADDNTPWPPKLVDKGEKAEKLERLKKKAATDRIIRKFKSPEDLRGLVIHALAEFEKAPLKKDNRAKLYLHPPNIIPKAPEPYLAHPYSLLQTAQVVGRQDELNLLTDWVTTNRRVPDNIRVFNLVAMGGMGKSAVAWKWFNDIAPHKMSNRAGWMWWSFYESDAHYENFIIRALAYTSGQSEKAVRQMQLAEREDQLWRILDEEPFFLVLDGLERILLAYSRMDASRMPEDDLDERTANRVAHALGLPESAGQSFLGKHHLRLTSDHRAGEFLRRLTRVRASRLLISTRLYPTALQFDTGDALSGCFAFFLQGLTDDDALNLWHEFNVSGSSELLLSMFRSFANFPLLIRALAGEVARYRPAPRDFNKWREDNPGFNPAAELDLKNAKTHVLEYALRGLGETQRYSLHTLAAFRMPASWETLRALLVTDKRTFLVDKQLCDDDRALDIVLTELEDRGLMGWDKRANRYDLHPIVRGVVWATLGPKAKRGIYRSQVNFFDAAAHGPESRKVESLEDLTPAVELFDKLIGLERYEDAFVIFRDQLDRATHYRFSASRLRAELLERLFPDGVNGLPSLETPHHQSQALNWLGAAYHFGGEPGRAALLQQRAAGIDERENHQKSLVTALCNLAADLIPSGQLRDAEYASRRALRIAQERQSRFYESVALYTIGTVLSSCGEPTHSQRAFRRSLNILVAIRNPGAESHVGNCLAQHWLWLGQPNEALPFAQRALERATISRIEHDAVPATRLLGVASMRLGDMAVAEERLKQALTRARAVNLVKEELQGLAALAELHWHRRQCGAARELLEQIWPSAERGPYCLVNADARYVLAQIERDESHRDAAIAAATRAYELAWCDGPPYGYHYGLTNATQLLAELGATRPQLPPFDESKFEPTRHVEINLADRFWVNPAKLD